MVSERNFSHYKSMGVIDPQGVASLNSRGLIGRIYVVEHKMLLHTKYMYIWFQRRFLKFLLKNKISLWKLLIHGMWPVLPQGLDWWDLCRGPLDITTY